ncbi:MAG: hypothetical protein HZA92_00560 [Verrucomicrobia bacterium]|nr:hypothetical protein [Verrucomicrobiota bacterium]
MRRSPILHSQFAIRNSPAFTLIEVVLAISIAIGLLLVAMHFYQQATSLRAQLLDEAERLAAVRQVMDRLAADLRVAPVHDRVGFSGDSNSLRFVITALPPASGGMQSDLRRVTYRATFAGTGTNLAVSGLVRTEEPAVDFLTSSRPAELATTDVETNASATSDPAAPAAAPTPALTASEPLTEAVRYLSFRFWDGTAWSESWSGVTPPPGVEVSLGFEPQASDLAPEQYPGEVFRRVIFLPAGRPRPPETNLVANVNSR